MSKHRKPTLDEATEKVRQLADITKNSDSEFTRGGHLMALFIHAYLRGDRDSLEKALHTLISRLAND